MINFTPETYNLTSMLANELSFTKQPSEMKIIVKAGSVSIYETTVYPVSGNYVLYGFRDLIENYLEYCALIGETVTVSVQNSSGTELESLSMKVVYARVYPDYETAYDFVTNSFLTTRGHYVIPRSGSVNLYFVCSETSNADAPSIVCKFLKDGVVSEYTYTPSYSFASGKWFQGISVIPRILTNSVTGKIGYNPGTLLCATVSSGSRSITIFVTDRTPDVRFSFLNAFNVMENIYIYGSTTIKTTLDFKDAECNGYTLRYNQSSEKSYEVETVPLSLDEADFINDFLTSKYIEYSLPDSANVKEVIVDDVDSEVCDSVKETVKIKFSWRTADNSKILDFKKIGQIIG